jgi:hypothetical protein
MTIFRIGIALFLTCLIAALPIKALQNPIQDALDAAQVQAAGGVELRLVAAVNAEQRVAEDHLLRLAVQIRNVGQDPIPFDAASISYQFEYEIDGTWYRPENGSSQTALPMTLAPGGQRQLSLIFAINDTYRYHGLYAAGARLNLTPGRHSLRVRALPFQPVSNTITVEIPARAARPVSPTPAAPVSNFRNFRFAAGPAGGLEVATNFLKRPPSNLAYMLANSPQLADFDALEVLPAVGWYDFSLREAPQTIDNRSVPVPTSALPEKTPMFAYLVRSAGQGILSIVVRVNPAGRTELWSASPQDASVQVRTLEQLATMEKVRSGSYEPRILRVFGRAGSTPRMNLWLRSASGNSDLYYVETLYEKEEFLRLAGQNRLPTKDAAWAIRQAFSCSGSWTTRYPLEFGKATAVPFESNTATLQWRVTIPQQMPTSIFETHTDLILLVDESTGNCARQLQN